MHIIEVRLWKSQPDILADANKTCREEYRTIFLAKSANNFFLFVSYWNIFKGYRHCSPFSICKEGNFQLFCSFFLAMLFKKNCLRENEKIKSLIGQHIQFFARQNLSRARAKKSFSFPFSLFLPSLNEDIHVTVMTNLIRTMIVHSSNQKWLRQRLSCDSF